MNRKNAKKLAETWIKGNNFRNASLVRKHNIKEAFNKDNNLAIRIASALEEDRSQFIPAIDENSELVFFHDFPPKLFDIEEMLENKNKNIKRSFEVVTLTERDDSIYRKGIMSRLFPDAEDELIESFILSNKFDLESFKVSDLKKSFANFASTVSEKIEYKIVAVDSNGDEFESKWMESEDQAASKASEMSDDKWESVSIIKRLANTPEEDEDKEPTIDLKLVQKKIKKGPGINPEPPHQKQKLKKKT